MEPISIELTSEGACVRGRFYTAEGKNEAVTLLFVPGWPAEPEDFLGLGPRLSQRGINMMEFSPRGLHPSEGTYTHSGALQDIRAALGYLRQPDTQKRFKVNPAKVALGGYSNGGGLAIAYTAQDASVRRLVSFAGNDFGEFARQIQSNPAMAEGIRQWLLTTRAPDGPARFDVDAGLQELADHPEVFGARENAQKLADRSILLLGGWEDTGPNVDQYQLPLYRALKSAGAARLTFIVYHTDHSFGNVRQRLAADTADWLLQE
jgi:dienelactone hydrolase